MNKIYWNYLKSDAYKNASQEDWNQTLITIFNFIVNRMVVDYNLTINDGIYDVIVPKKFKKIIDSWLVNHKFNITFVDVDSNIIKFTKQSLVIINFKDDNENRGLGAFSTN